MAVDPFTISADRAAKRLTMTFTSVFWSLDDAERFERECRAAVASLGCGPGQHLTLIDLRNAILQSRDVFERMQAIAAASVAARIALVASSPLSRMQTKRLQVRDTVRLFADMAEAEAWLGGGDGACEAAA